MTSEVEARDRWDRGIPDAAMNPYWIIIGDDPESPDVVVEVRSGRSVLTVYFLDELNRKVGSHLFIPEDEARGFVQEGRLFLEQVYAARYAEDDDRRPPYDDPSWGMTTRFKRDGSWYAIQQSGNQESEEAWGSLPPDEAAKVLWEPTPNFGEWDSLIRRDR